jgi:hypothetical protein
MVLYVAMPLAHVTLLNSVMAVHRAVLLIWWPPWVHLAVMLLAIAIWRSFAMAKTALVPLICLWLMGPNAALA